MELLVIIGVVIGIKIFHAVEDAKFDNFSTKNVSVGKMIYYGQDKSPRQVRREMMQGKYDKDEHWKI